MTPEEYCKDKTVKSGSSFYYSFLFLDKEQRKAMMALYAFCREVDDIVDADMQASIATIKLQWWREEVERIFSKQAQHPVGKALQPVIDRFDLAREYFLEIIDGMEMDLQQQRYDTFSELSLYCYRVASVVGLLSAEIFGYADRNTLKYAKDLGMAFQLTNIIRDVHEDAQRGRIYLPLEDLQKFDVNSSDILNNKESDNFYRLMNYEAQRAYEYYQRAMQHLPEADRYPQRAGLIMSAIYRSTLDEVAADGFKVLTQRVSLTPIRKLWLAFKTLLHEKRRFRKLRAQRASA